MGLLVMDEARERYRTDARFQYLVDCIRAVIHRGDLTSHDVARAAVLACQLHAEENLGPVTVVLEEGEPHEGRLSKRCGVCGVLHVLKGRRSPLVTLEVGRPLLCMSCGAVLVGVAPAPEGGG